ncbi:12791_t:CDS:2, partial [Gigaspora margarita]
MDEIFPFSELQENFDCRSHAQRQHKLQKLNDLIQKLIQSKVFTTNLAPENPTKKIWILLDLELEIFTQNQPDAATFTKPIPITK